MMKLVCRDYGFECNFQAEGKNIFHVAEYFGKHIIEKHGRDFSKEALTDYIIRAHR